MSTTIERINCTKDKELLKKLVVEGRKSLNDTFAKSSQSELLELLEEKSSHIFASTGDIVKVAGTIGKNKVYNVFATTTQGTKLKLSKQHMDNVESLKKDMPINVTLRFSEVKETEVIQKEGESVESFEDRQAQQIGLLKYRVEFQGKFGYVLFDNISW